GCIADTACSADIAAVGPSPLAYFDRRPIDAERRFYAAAQPEFAAVPGSAAVAAFAADHAAAAEPRPVAPEPAVAGASRTGIVEPSVALGSALAGELPAPDG